MILPKDFPSNKKILYCVLNWGLGHASRSIPVIKNLIQKNNDVLIASDGLPLKLLKENFSNNTFIDLPSYNVTYPTKFLSVNILYNTFNIYKAVQKENMLIKNLYEQYKFDLIISDNRPGCYAKNIKNIYMTHQLHPYHENKLFAYLLKKINSYYACKFQEFWIPDFDDHRLAGMLSKPLNTSINHHYLGALSSLKPSNNHTKKYILTVLSGPEPQRSYLEEELYEKLSNSLYKHIIFVRGTDKPSSKIISTEKIKVITYASHSDIEEWMNQASLFIGRTGYSTIMDLYTIQIDHAILIPTPGQTEQEYLGKLHQNKWKIMEQGSISI